MSSQMKPVSVETIADGVVPELFKREMERVAANIVDLNTDSRAKRKITLEFSFEPDEERSETRVIVTAKSTLAPVKSFKKTIYCGKAGGKAQLFAQNSRQLDMIDVNSQEQGV